MLSITCYPVLTKWKYFWCFKYRAAVLILQISPITSKSVGEMGRKKSKKGSDDDDDDDFDEKFSDDMNDILPAPPPLLPAPLVVIEELWAQCDRCQKWRLLPPGTTPPPDNVPW
jgi:hypothetical protein